MYNICGLVYCICYLIKITVKGASFGPYELNILPKVLSSTLHCYYEYLCDCEKELGRLSSNYVG